MRALAKRCVSASIEHPHIGPGCCLLPGARLASDAASGRIDQALLMRGIDCGQSIDQAIGD